MATITNHSRAVRVINATVDGKVRSVAIEPGASVEAEPVKTKGFTAAVEAGHLSVKTAASAKAETPAKDDASVKAAGPLKGEAAVKPIQKPIPKD